MSVFDYIRERITRIADETLAIDGAYPVWSYADLTMLLDNLEIEWEKKHPGKSIGGMTMWYQCDMCNEPVDEQDVYRRGCRRRLIDERFD